MARFKKDFHYRDFCRQNKLIKDLLDHSFRNVLYLNVATSTVLRTDTHMDPIHYCSPGPVDKYVLLIFFFIFLLSSLIFTTLFSFLTHNSGNALHHSNDISQIYLFFNALELISRFKITNVAQGTGPLDKRYNTMFYDYLEGKAMKSNTNRAIYLFEYGTKRLITNYDIFLSLNLTEYIISDSDLSWLVPGPPIISV